MSLTLLLAGRAVLAQDKTNFKFSFAANVPAGFIAVSPDQVYDKDRGYGFEPGVSIVADAKGFVTGSRPFYFSIALPEGNYNVTLTLGDPAGESTTTVKAELRRLMLEQVYTGSGKLTQRTITVNIRRPRIATGGEVQLKGSREKVTEAWAWDDKLTLEFNGPRPCLDAVEISPAPDAVTVYLLGDSTVCDQPLEPWNSWGQMLPRFFKSGVAVSNQAESGETADSSLRARRLDKVLSTIKKGDYLFIQFGHNDMKEKGPGIGPYTSYTQNLLQYVEGARTKGAIPVLVTSMNRKTMDSSGHVTNSLGDYPQAVRKLAAERNVAIIDLNAMSKTLYEAIGPKNLSRAFVDGTHHNAYGSYELAKCVILGMMQNKLDLCRFISDDWKDFDPAHPDAIESFSIPASPASSTTRPLGN
jgi:lysophospholipase L1-like esterase